MVIIIRKLIKNYLNYKDPAEETLSYLKRLDGKLYRLNTSNLKLQI